MPDTGMTSLRLARPALSVIARIGSLSWLLALFLLLWEAWFRLFPSLFVPPMTVILGRTLTKWFAVDPHHLFTSEAFQVDALASLGRFAVGWGLATVIGIVAGFIIGRSSVVAALSRGVIRFGVSTPSTILLPVAVVIFGVADSMNIFLIAVGSVWPVLLNTIDAVKGFDPAMADSARSLRLRGRRLYAKVVFRAVSPQIVAGTRVSLGIALILVILSEMFVATKGIGFEIIYSQRTFAFTEMWASVAFVGMLAILLNSIFGAGERKILSWHREMGRSHT